jgi:hypothetical protein
MKRSILFMTVASLAGTLMAAPKDEVQSAVKKLGDAGYSWTSTTTNLAAPAGGGGGGGRGFGGGGGPVQGKVGKDGIALITSTSNRGGSPTTTERVVKGDKSAMKNQEGAWQTPEEMMAAFGGGPGGAPGGAPGGGRGRGGGGMFCAQPHPATQAEDLLSKVKDVTMAGGVYSGDLTEDGVKALLAFGGRGGGQGPDIAGAKGSAKFWLKDGVLSKYEFNLQGTMSFGGNDMPMNRTTTIEIKDVGTTTVTIPDEAKKKVS